MKIRILGPRVLVRAYSLPETIGSIIVPESVREQYDGKSFEVVAVGDDVARLVGIGGERGDEVYPILKEGVGGIPDLLLQPDDILLLRYQFRGVWAGPEVRDFYGTDCWFVNVVETQGTHGEHCVIQKVLPSRFWKEEGEAA
jgi:hypothetical protein